MLDSIIGLLILFRGRRVALIKTCKKLRKLSADCVVHARAKDIAWKYYIKALSLAEQCGREEIIRVVLEFDAIFSEDFTISSPSARRAIIALLSPEPCTQDGLEAALRLSLRVGDRESWRVAQQKRFVLYAFQGDANALLVKLLERRKEGLLEKGDLTEIFSTFLNRWRFEPHFPWKAFFSELEEDQLPPIHQVYALLDRYIDAADLAKANGDRRSALRYLTLATGAGIAARALALAESLGDQPAIAQTRLNLAEDLWEKGNYADALVHFSNAAQFTRASDCHQKLGQFAEAINVRPSITAEWILGIRAEMETIIHSHLAKKEFPDAVRILGAVREALQSKGQDNPVVSVEADRIQRLLSKVVETARESLGTEVRTSQAQPGAEVFKRWSLMEEAARNYREAGLYAEMAQDYFAASLMYEKADAFGQALSALGRTHMGVEPARKADLLERGGDFFMAGLLYEGMGVADKAISLYEQAAEFVRAAELRRKQIGDEKATSDDRFLDLLARADRVESLAELCYSKTQESERLPEEKAFLFRRIKQLVDRGLVGQKWLSRIAAELPQVEALEKARFDERADEWTQAATHEVLGNYVDAFGLDLGTSNSVVALFNKVSGEAEVVEWRGQQHFPSVFAIDQDGRRIVGMRESELIGLARAVVPRVKREMGTERKFKAGGQLYRPEEISAQIIGHACTLAKQYLMEIIRNKISLLATKALGVSPPDEWIIEHLDQHQPSLPIDLAVITVPAYFNDSQKAATRTAGQLAGINVLRLIHEPTAACLAQRFLEERDETILVVDLGAGTLDLSMVDTGAGVFQVREIEGDSTIGSSDLDELLHTHFREVIKNETGHDTTVVRQADARLRQGCEDLQDTTLRAVFMDSRAAAPH